MSFAMDNKDKKIVIRITTPRPIDHKSITWTDLPDTTYFVPIEITIDNDLRVLVLSFSFERLTDP